MSTEPSPHEVALTRTKMKVMGKGEMVFFTTILFSLQTKFSDKVPTMGTDGKCLYINADFFMKQDDDQRIFLMFHEAMHVAYMHVGMHRIGTRDPKKWNIAADYLINGHLDTAGLKMPKGGYLDHRYDGLSTEEIYDLLPDGMSPPEMEDLISSDGDGEADGEELRQHIEGALIRANLAVLQRQADGYKPGYVPGDLAIYLDKLLKPKLSWKHILRRYLHSFNKNDYSFKRPNKRYLPNHYLPSLYSINLDEIAVAIDVSGSVTDEQFQKFISETASILKMMRPKVINFIQFDTSIKSVNRVKTLNDLLNLKFTGRGGTNVTPVIEWANKHKPKVILVFTDGKFYAPKVNTNVPVVWLIHDDQDQSFKSDFGRIIHYPLET